MGAPPSVGLAPLLARARAAIFDMNGVLMDDEPAHFEAFRVSLRALGATLTYDEYLRHCAGRTDREGVDNLLKSKHLSADPEQLVGAKRESYERDPGHVPFPGAVDVARHLNRTGVRCFLVTSSDKQTASNFIASSQLEDVFPPDRCFFELESDGRADVYLEIIRQSGDKAAACLLIDDSPANLNVGRRLGVTTVGVATTHAVEHISADVIVNGPLTLSKLQINTQDSA